MLFSNFKYLSNIQYFLIITLFLTLPYKIAPAFPLLLSFLIFLTAFFTFKMRLKELFLEKILLILFSFILFVYMSVFWSPADDIFGGDFKVTLLGYLSYLLLIPAIYFSNLSQKQFNILFLSIAASPSIYVILYFTNFFHLTNFYPLQTESIGHYMYPDLFANIFILFSSIFLFIKLLNTMLAKNYFHSVLILLPFFLVTTALFINEESVSRLINLVWVASILFVTFYLLPSRLKLPSIVTIGLLAILYISNSDSFKRGLIEVKASYENQIYEGSWGHRIKLSQYGIMMWLENPLIGRGPTDINDKMREIRQENPHDFNDPTVHFHNQHLLILVQTGIIGYSLFLIFIYYLYKLDIENKDIYLFKQITIFIYFLLMNGEHYLQMIFTSTFLALLIALFLNYKRQETKYQINNLPLR